jgi:hypothetical protein
MLRNKIVMSDCHGLGQSGGSTAKESRCCCLLGRFQGIESHPVLLAGFK